MKLLVLSQFYWPEPVGTASYATDLARWFAARGDDVTVLTARPNYPDYRVLDEYRSGRHDESVVDGVRICRLSTWAPGRDSAWRRVRHELWLLLSTVVALLRGRVARHSHVVSFCPSIFTVLAGALARRRGGSHVAIVHDVQSGLASGLGMAGGGVVGLIRLVERFALNRADVVLVLSAEMKRQLEALGVRSRLEVLPLWVDTEKVFPLPARNGGAPLVAYSGNLGRKQGLDQVLALAAVLRDRRPDVRVVIRGQGSQADRLRREASENNLTNVEFTPLIPEERLNEALAEVDVHLVPQLPGGADSAVPSKAYTIMAAGRPFICTTEPGSTLWTLQEQTQAFVCSPPNDPQAMADALLALIDSPKERDEMGRRGHRYIESHVKRDRVLSRLAGLLREASTAPLVAIGPLPPPVHGMARVTDRVIRHLERHAPVSVADVSPGGLNRSLPYHARKSSRVLRAAVLLRRHSRARGARLYMPCDGAWGMLYTSFLARLARRYGYRIVIHHHNFSYVVASDRRMKAVVRAAGRRARHVFLCPRMRDEFLTLYPLETEPMTLSNALLVPPHEGTAPKARQRVTIGHLGNLGREKGLDLVLELFSALHREGRDVRFALAGPLVDAEAERWLASARDELGDALDYRGALDGEDKRRFYSELDIFLFPSRMREAQPLVILEALSHGVPTVAYAHGCVPEMLAGGVGVTVAPDRVFAENALPEIRNWLDRPEVLRVAARASRRRFDELRARSAGELDRLVEILGAA